MIRAGLAIALVVGGLGAVLGTAPASADPSPVITLSKDGSVWSTSLPDGLFDSFQGAVPGDSTTQTFYVKNPLTTEVTMQTRAMNVHSTSGQLDQAITVDGTAGGHSLAAPVTLASLSNCSTIAPDLLIPAGSAVKVSVTLAMADVSGDYASSSQGGFDVLLTMQDAEAGPGATSCDSTDPTHPTDPTNPSNGGGRHHHNPGTNPTGPTSPLSVAGSPLAFTGVDMIGSVIIAAILFGFGFALLIWRRRRREREES